MAYRYTPKRISTDGSQIPNLDWIYLSPLWDQLKRDPRSVLHDTDAHFYFRHSGPADWWVLVEEPHAGGPYRYVALVVCRLMRVHNGPPLLVLRDFGIASKWPRGQKASERFCDFLVHIRGEYADAGVIFRADERWQRDLDFLDSACGFMIGRAIKKKWSRPERRRRKRLTDRPSQIPKLKYYKATLGRIEIPQPLAPAADNVLVGGSGAWDTNLGTDEESYVGTEYGGYYRHRMVLLFNNASTATPDLLLQFPEEPGANLDFKIERLVDSEEFHETQSTWRKYKSSNNWTDEGGTVDSSLGSVSLEIPSDITDLYITKNIASLLPSSAQTVGLRVSLETETGSQGMDFYMRDSDYPPALV